MNTLHWSRRFTPVPHVSHAHGGRPVRPSTAGELPISVGWFLHGTVLTRKLPLFDCCCVALILETKIKLLKNLLQSLGDLEFAKPSCPFFLPPWSLIHLPNFVSADSWSPLAYPKAPFHVRSTFGEYTYFHLRIWVNWKNSPTLNSKSPIKPYTNHFPWVRYVPLQFHLRRPNQLTGPGRASALSSLNCQLRSKDWTSWEVASARCDRSCTMLCLGNVSYTDTKG